MRPAKSLPIWLTVSLIVGLLFGVGLRFIYLERKIMRFDEVFNRLHTAAHDEHREANPTLYTGELISAEMLQRFQHHDPSKTLLDTYRTLNRKEPSKTPLYFTLAWGWTRLFDSKIETYRALSAIFGVLALPATYWLCRELRFARAAGVVATVLMALSPIMIRQSQDARPYSIWLLATLLVCVFLLRAIRFSRRSDWVLYAAAAAAALYVQLLSIVVRTAHAGFIALRWWQRRNSAEFAAYIIASASGLLLFTPWGVLIWRRRATIWSTTSYLSQSLDQTITLRQSALNLSHLLFGWPPTHTWLLPFATAATLLLIIVATAHFLPTAKQEGRILIGLLILVNLAVFVLPDLLFGGQRAVRARYFIPAYSATILIIGDWLAAVAKQRWGQWLLTAILLATATSSVYSVQAATWWGLSQVDLDVAEIVNREADSLFVSDVPFGVIGILTDQLASSTQLQLTKEPETLTLAEHSGTTFVYNPSKKLIQRMHDTTQGSLTLVYQNQRWDGPTVSLYKLEP